MTLVNVGRGCIALDHLDLGQTGRGDPLSRGAYVVVVNLDQCGANVAAAGVSIQGADNIMALAGAHADESHRTRRAAVDLRRVARVGLPAAAH